MKCTRWNNRLYRSIVLFCRALFCAQKAGSWSDLHAMWLKSVRLFRMFLSQLDFAAESCGIGRLAKILGIPIMRTKLATTALEMPLYGISFPLSAFSVSSTVFRNSEKLSCANEVSASKPLFPIKACFYPPRISLEINSTQLLFFKMQNHCALKNCINPFLQL